MAKHIIEENIKTIGGQSIVGKGDIEISSGEVKVDNKTITKNKQGELQLGVLNEELAIELDLEDHPLRMVYYGGETYTTFYPGAIVLMDNGSSLGITSGSLFMDDEYGGGRLGPNLVSLYNREGGVNFTTDTIELFNGTSLKYPKKTGENTLVISVNDIQADENGNITLPSEEGKTDNKTISKNKDGELQLGVFDESFGTNIVKGIITSNMGFNVNDKYGGSVIINPSFLEGAVRPDNGDSFDYRLTSSGFTFRSTSAGYSQSVEVGETGIGYYSNNWYEENETFEGILKYPNLSSKSRVITASVNGVFADENGNITIPSEEGKTDNKTISKNEDGELQLGVFNDGEYLLKDVRITIEASESQNDFTTIDSGSIAVQTTDNHGNITYAEVKSNGFLHSENLELPAYNVDFPKEFTSEDKLKVNMTFSVNDVFADEKGNIEIPSEKLSNQFLTNTEGEKILAVDGGAYGQIPGFSLKEIAGGIAKGAVVGDAGLLTDEGNSQGVLSAYIDQGYAKVITNTAKLIDEANDSVISGKQEVIAQSEYAHSEYVTSLSKGLSGEGGKLYASRLGSSTTTKYGAESYLKSSYNQSGNHTESSISVRADEDLSVITAITENFIVRNALTGKEYSIMEILDPLMARKHIKLPLLQGYSSTVDYEDPTATRIGDQVYYNINIVKTNGSLEVGDVVLKIPSSHLPFRPKPIFAQSNSGTIQLELKTNGDIVVRHIVEGTGLMQVCVSGSYLINQDY